MKYLVDNQLPAALSQFLVKRGLDCKHVLEVGLAEASDAEICRYAVAEGRVIISKDQDFLHFANRPETQVKVIWVRSGNCRTLSLLAAFERLWSTIETCLEAGETVVEVR